MTALAAFVACARELAIGACMGLLFGAVLIGVAMEGEAHAVPVEATR